MPKWYEYQFVFVFLFCRYDIASSYPNHASMMRSDVTFFLGCFFVTVFRGCLEECVTFFSKEEKCTGFIIRSERKCNGFFEECMYHRYVMYTWNGFAGRFVRVMLWTFLYGSFQKAALSWRDWLFFCLSLSGKWFSVSRYAELIGRKKEEIKVTHALGRIRNCTHFFTPLGHKDCCTPSVENKKKKHF